MSDLNTFCVECGPGVKVDEDGLCVLCGATATGSALSYINRLRAQVEELEDASVKEVLDFGVEQMSRGHDKYHIITSKMIGEAVVMTLKLYRNGCDCGWLVLNKLNIFKCEGCSAIGHPSVTVDEEGREWKCSGCDGKGWVVKDE